MDGDWFINWGTGFTLVNPPRNWKGIMPQVVFTSRINKPFLSLGNLEWVGTNADNLNAYYNAGNTGGRGICEGVPLQIFDKSNNLLFNGVINLSDASATFECDMVIAPVQEKGRIDWFNDVAASFTFRTLLTLGYIVPSTDYKKTPYALSELPNYSQAAILAITEFEAVIKLLETIAKLNELTEKSGGDIATDTIQLGTSTPTVASDLLIIFIYIIEIIAIIAAMVVMLIKIIGQFIQPKKYKLCMREQDLFLRGCQNLGLNFSVQ